MIRQAHRCDLRAIHTDSPFFVRILSLYECYGEGYDFVSFWVQENEGETVAAISLFEDKFSLYLTEKSDLEELELFLRFGGGKGFLFDAKYALNIPHENYISGDVLEYKGSYNSDKELYTPEIKALYSLLQACSAPDFRVPDYLTFLSDVTHRRNLSKCDILALSCDGVLASAAMTVSCTENAVIIGAVATHPDFRKRGFSRRVVCSLSEKMRARGKRVFVLSASEKNTLFYQHSGFETVAGFMEIFT